MSHASITRRSGFSLVELSVVLVIMAVVAGGALKIASSRIEINKEGVTRERMDRIEQSLENFRKANNRIPCPVDGTIAIDNANFGKELNGDPGVCTGALADPSTNAVVGMLPVRTLQLPDEMAFDGWGRRFTFAADKRMTQTNAFDLYKLGDQNGGDLRVLDANGADRTPAPPNGAIYVLVSHGKNGHGAWRRNGGVARENADSANADEQQNCNCNNSGGPNANVNNVFVMKDYNVDLAGSSSFDDIVRYKVSWGLRYASEGTAEPTDSATDYPLSLAVGHIGATKLTLYTNNSATDSFLKLSQPDVDPGSTVYDISFSQDNSFMALVKNASPYVQVYDVNGTTVTDSGEPSTALAGIGRSVDISMDGKYMAVGHSTAPYLTFYKHVGSSFNKLVLNAPDTPPAGTGMGVAFSPDRAFVAVAASNASYISAYTRSGDTFTKIPAVNFDTVNAATGGMSVAWSPDSLMLAVAYNAAPYITVYSRSGASFTKITTGAGEFAASRPSSLVRDVAFSHDGTYLAAVADDTPGVYIYKRSGNNFTLLSAPNGPMGGSPAAGTSNYSIGFSDDDNYLSIVSDTAPYLYVYKRTGDVFDKLPDLTDLPPSNSVAVAFTKDPSLVASTTTPSIVSVAPPTNGTYSTGTDLDFTVTFSENVDITGTPRIPIVIGSTTRYATYVSGTGGTDLVFRYTVVAADGDTDGITMISPMELNGGTIKSTLDLVDATLTYTLPDTSAVLVGDVPSITNVSVPDANYTTGQWITVTVTYDQVVNVTGSPYIALSIGAATRNAVYNSGTGTNTLTFRYQVAAGDQDTDGIVVNSPVNLNAGTIKNAGLINAGLTFTSPTTTGVMVNGAPSITTVSKPADGDYINTQQLDFTVTYSQAVSVTGTPRLQLTIGSTTAWATYVSGSGTTNLLFRYVVGLSDNDTDGITMTSPVDLNGGTIKNGMIDAGLTFTPPTMSNVKVNSIGPVINNMAGPAAGVYNTNDVITFTATFNKVVNVNTGGGTPRIALTLGTGTVYANYVSGTGTSDLVFQYTVQAADGDCDGMAMASSVALNGGTIRDAASNNATLTFSAPTVSGVYLNSTGSPDLVVASQTGGGKLKLGCIHGTSNKFGLVPDASPIANSDHTQVAWSNDNMYLAVKASTTVYVYKVNGSSVTRLGATFTGSTYFAFSPDGKYFVVTDGTRARIYKIGAGDSFTLNQTITLAATATNRVDFSKDSKYMLLAGGSAACSMTLYRVDAGDVFTSVTAPTCAVASTVGFIKFSNTNAYLAVSHGTTTYIYKNNGGGSFANVSNFANASEISWSNDDNYIASTDATSYIRLWKRTGDSFAQVNSQQPDSGTVFKDVSFSKDGRFVIAGSDESDPIREYQIWERSGDALTNLNITESYGDPRVEDVMFINDGNVVTAGPYITNMSKPADATYVTGNTLQFTATFSAAVNITGTPRLKLTIGSTTRYADYVSGTGTTNIVFSYTVQNTDQDLNGITMHSPLELNGGTIKDGGGLDAGLGYTVPTTTGVIIDNAPYITSVTKPADATYGTGQNLDFVMTYNQVVTVSGTPKIQITIGASVKDVTYLSGSGTNALTFRYTVANGDNDSDGITMSGTVVHVSGSTIQNAQLIDGKLPYTAPNTTGVKVDTSAPSITARTAPANGTYANGQDMDFTFTFSEPVIVNTGGGTPQLALTFGGTTVFADYLSGSGTTVLTFRHTVAPPDKDCDGIAMGLLSANGGTIRDASGNDAVLTYTPPVTTGIYVGACQVDMIYSSFSIYQIDNTSNTVTKLTNPASGDQPDSDAMGVAYSRENKYIAINDHLIQHMSVYKMVGPTLTKLGYVSPISGGNGWAARVTFSGTDNYMAFSGQLSDDLYIAKYNTATDAFTDLPTVTSVAGRIRGMSFSQDGKYVAAGGESTIPRRFGIVKVTAGTDTFALLAGQPDTQPSGNVYDVAFSHDSRYIAVPDSTTNVVIYKKVAVDDFDKLTTGTPTCSTAKAAAWSPNDSYLAVGGNCGGNRIAVFKRIGDTFDATGITFDSYPTADVKAVAWSPDDKYLAMCVSGSSTIKMYKRTGNAFTSVAVPVVNPFSSGDCDIKFPNDPSYTPNAIIDSVTAPSNGNYNAGQQLNFTVNYSLPVTVDTTGGTPRIELTIGSTTQYATYVSGTGTNALVFRYTVQAGDFDANGISLNSPIDTNGGTIKYMTNDAGVTFTPPTLTGVVVNYAPYITGVSVPATAWYILNNQLNFTVTYNEAMTVTGGAGSAQLNLDIGGISKAATYVSGSGTANLLFRYTVQAGLEDFDGIIMDSPIQMNSGVIRSTATSIAGDLTFTPPDTSGVRVDSLAPTISSVTPPANGTYSKTQNLTFTVNTSENVVVTGTPRLRLTIGATTRYATYVSGSGTDTLVFQYAIQAGEVDNDGIALNNTLDLNGGTIKDPAGNALTPLTFTVPNLTGVLVNGNVPSIISVTPPASATYANGATLSWVVKWNGNVATTGTPRVKLDVGGVTRYATYASGSGTTDLTFTYTLAAGENNCNIVKTISPVELNGGTINDLSSNPAGLTFTAVSDVTIVSATTGVDMALPNSTNLRPYCIAQTAGVFRATQLPDVPLGGQATSIEYSYNNTYIAVSIAPTTGHDVFRIYKVVGPTLTLIQSYTDSDWSCWDGESVSWAPNNTYVATYCSHGSSSTPVHVIKRTGGDTFVHLTALAGADTSVVYDVKFSGNSTWLVSSGWGSGDVVFYKRSSDTFTDKGNILSPTATERVNDLSFSPTSATYLVNMSNWGGGSPYYAIYKKNATLDRYDRLADPVCYIEHGGSQAEWSPNGNLMATIGLATDSDCPNAGSTGLRVYRRSTDTFTVVSGSGTGFTHTSTIGFYDDTYLIGCNTANPSNQAAVYKDNGTNVVYHQALSNVGCFSVDFMALRH